MIRYARDSANRRASEVPAANMVKILESGIDFNDVQSENP